LKLTSKLKTCLEVELHIAIKTIDRFVSGRCDQWHGPNVAPAAPSKAPRANDSFRPRSRHLIYVAVPGSLERPGWMNGVGIVVLDANDNYRFVKRIPTWEYARA